MRGVFVLVESVVQVHWPAHGLATCFRLTNQRVTPTVSPKPRKPSERRWVVLYDADCGLCKWLLSGLLRWDRTARLHPIALQRSEAADLLRELTPSERMA